MVLSLGLLQTVNKQPEPNAIAIAIKKEKTIVMNLFISRFGTPFAKA
jgi:hypothetical protein